jgi:hypothetical protein
MLTSGAEEILPGTVERCLPDTDASDAALAANAMRRRPHPAPSLTPSRCRARARYLILKGYVATWSEDTCACAFLTFKTVVVKSKGEHVDCTRAWVPSFDVGRWPNCHRPGCDCMRAPESVTAARVWRRAGQSPTGYVIVHLRLRGLQQRLQSCIPSTAFLLSTATAECLDLQRSYAL